MRADWCRPRRKSPPSGVGPRLPVLSSQIGQHGPITNVLICWIELGLALQRADALPTEPRRTITESRRTITEPRRTITEPRRTMLGCLGLSELSSSLRSYQGRSRAIIVSFDPALFSIEQIPSTARHFIVYPPIPPPKKNHQIFLFLSCTYGIYAKIFFFVKMCWRKNAQNRNIFPEN